MIDLQYIVPHQLPTSIMPIFLATLLEDSELSSTPHPIFSTLQLVP